jgi:hypothetical protein
MPGRAHHRLDIHGLHLPPHVEFELVERSKCNHRRGVNEDIASPVAVEHLSGCRAHCARIGEIDTYVALSIEDRDGVVLS